MQPNRHQIRSSNRRKRQPTRRLGVLSQGSALSFWRKSLMFLCFCWSFARILSQSFFTIIFQGRRYNLGNSQETDHHNINKKRFGFIHLLIHFFICSFILSFILSFICSFNKKRSLLLCNKFLIGFCLYITILLHLEDWSAFTSLFFFCMIFVNFKENLKIILFQQGNVPIKAFI